MKFLSEVGKENLNGKKVFLRVDFNVPVEGGGLKEIYRIKAHKETIDYLISAGARVALISHIENSFKNIVSDIGKILGYELGFEDDVLNPALNSPLTLFENIRKYEGEEKNDDNFALNLSKNFDLYVDDAFSVSHRNHTSVSAITKFLPPYVGFLMNKEIKNLEKVLNEPASGKTIILGGAKISTKIPVIKNFLNKADHILIGGALANTIFKFKGLDIGRSLIEDSEVTEALKETDWDDPKILLPEDIAVSDDKTGESTPEITQLQNLKNDQYILDVGPETIKQFSEIIRDSKIIIFNGPLGLVEIDVFAVGTKMLLDSIIRSKAFSVVGGGDTLALIEKLGLFGKFSYVSTGGGAMLEFLAENKLHGLEALGYYGE
ncbi:MAG: phosphoglycerate kinase [Parcubacteria group bacterium RIFCSPLOWO2_01_FULL_40_65]|nr:MAG: phosphoglycerate kinase [Parcubacteria group bacterium RIFCSPHIGHO2_01_FULL_40_30]OHB19854.1 MAG: phosphoglycerate kinase [Parcubacteria group bacterium RIFCSPHIGHO2_02_FULL_40_12]OHB21565.1 MAG: phosphoglycerate kinase [Parcubacteria group bacterium RIFCSPLOWO2_01_FULL_40_65]OHB23509.1 MAG: phosphoglycerate kinase [Parcubacteria group bacterium RIFCSPLOWO2_02_FULL_40_12]OHB24016.1 MAG: phosphoglycerate kinase [Parcubacteria group bacterium RIFCSPLOWO2_12_FULL_40_10]